MLYFLMLFPLKNAGFSQIEPPNLCKGYLEKTLLIVEQRIKFSAIRILEGVR